MGNHVGQPKRSQFLLHSKEAPDYDEEPPHVAFGKVVSGFDVIRLVKRMVGNEFVPFFASVNRCLRSDFFPIANCATDGGDGDSTGKAEACI
ncbi:unnamed protein product [Brassica oleracea]